MIIVKMKAEERQLRTGRWDLNLYTWPHLVLAEQVFLLKGEQDDVSVVSRVFDADFLCSVLQHSRRLVDDPVWTEERQQ